jgi:hypothetical protein
MANSGKVRAGGPQRLALSKVEAAEALGVSIDFLDEYVMHELRAKVGCSSSQRASSLTGISRRRPLRSTDGQAAAEGPGRPQAQLRELRGRLCDGFGNNILKLIQR